MTNRLSKRLGVHPYDLRLPALRVRQSESSILFSFAVDGKRLQEFATVSRIKRSASGRIAGYQRPEVLSHIKEIQSYLESGAPMIPNAVVIAFDDRVRFEAHDIANGAGYSATGELVIPIDPSVPDEEKPGWVVDGQQRLAAIRDADIDSFPICAVAFVATTEEEQREQFILVNSTKPLPKGLIYELLPGTSTHLPDLLRRRKFPAEIMTALNSDPKSPLFGMVKTPTNPGGVIKDNSVLRMLENSLSDGILYRLNTGNEEKDIWSMLGVLNGYWSAVKEVFPKAWGLPSRRSRLMHGAGIVSLGFLMDAIADRHRDEGIPSADIFANDLRPISEVCRWTDGFWDFGPGKQRKWNEVQNTSKDVQLLSNYLLVQYKSRVWNQADRARE